MNPLQTNTIVIPSAINGAPGVAKSELSGSVFYCKSATLPFKVQFDTGSQFDFDQGFEYPVGAFSKQWFYNYTAWPITVTYYVGAAGVSFVGTSDTKVAETYFFGNLGLQANGTYNGQSISFGSGPQTQYIKLSGSSKIYVSGINDGHRRKQIVLSVASSTSGNLGDIIFSDAKSNSFFPVTAGSSPTFECSGDAVILVRDNLSTAYFVVGEIYYAA